MVRIPGSLRALLAGLIDYAGLYPPACLPVGTVIERYNAFLRSPENWILNRLVLPSSVLSQIRIESHWRVTLLVDQEPGPLPPQIETLETKSPGRLSLPTYCETPLAEIGDGFAKIRTGGLTPDAIPSPETLAEFLADAASRRMPFKATAGLHHPVRSSQPLTYQPGGPVASVHGFLNLFTAAAFAWQGAQREVLVSVLSETDPAAFAFSDDGLSWRGRTLDTAKVRASRLQFAHSFGSCSFEEPVTDLQRLGLLS